VLKRTAEALRVRPRGRPTASTGALVVEYSPQLDGDPDPGEIVWTWVPYEDDPRQGKDRPVVVLGRRAGGLVAVALTSKAHRGAVPVGTGPWDPQRRPSYAKVDRLLALDPAAMRREGAILARGRFDAVVAGVHSASSAIPRKSTGNRD
jgi:hypothetical protein